MPSWPPTNAEKSAIWGAVALLPVLLPLPALVALTACGSQAINDFPPPCPRLGIPPDAGDITRYRPTGQDLTDLVLDGQIQGVNGTCKPGGKDKTAAQLGVSFRMTRGPAAVGRSADLSYFVAVLRGDQILDKAVYPLHVDFPSNTDSVAMTDSPVTLVLPTPPGTTGASYSVVVSFQLTQDELALNRKRGPR